MKYILVCDLDDTLTGNREAILEFSRTLVSHRGIFYLVYSSGRFKQSMISLIHEKGLPVPDAIIANVGTEIYYAPHWTPDRTWEKILAEQWSEDEILQTLTKFEIQPQPYTKRVVLSHYVEDRDVVEKIEKAMRNYEVTLIHTKGYCLDILPAAAGKGSSAMYLKNKLSLPTICCGDSENDIGMLKKGDRGILVGNAAETIKRTMSTHSYVYILDSCHAYGGSRGITAPWCTLDLVPHDFVYLNIVISVYLFKIFFISKFFIIHGHTKLVI